MCVWVRMYMTVCILCVRPQPVRICVLMWGVKWSIALLSRACSNVREEYITQNPSRLVFLPLRIDVWYKVLLVWLCDRHTLVTSASRWEFWMGFDYFFWLLWILPLSDISCPTLYSPVCLSYWQNICLDFHAGGEHMFVCLQQSCYHRFYAVALQLCISELCKGTVLCLREKASSWLVHLCRNSGNCPKETSRGLKKYQDANNSRAFMFVGELLRCSSSDFVTFQVSILG